MYKTCSEPNTTLLERLQDACAFSVISCVFRFKIEQTGALVSVKTMQSKLQSLCSMFLFVTTLYFAFTYYFVLFKKNYDLFIHSQDNKTHITKSQNHPKEVFHATPNSKKPVLHYAIRDYPKTESRSTMSSGTATSDARSAESPAPSSSKCLIPATRTETTVSFLMVTK